MGRLRHDVLVGSDLTMAVPGGGGDEGEGGGGGPRCGPGPKLVTDSGKRCPKYREPRAGFEQSWSPVEIGCPLFEDCAATRPSPAQPSPNPQPT